MKLEKSFHKWKDFSKLKKRIGKTLAEHEINLNNIQESEFRALDKSVKDKEKDLENNRVKLRELRDNETENSKAAKALEDKSSKLLKYANKLEVSKLI